MKFENCLECGNKIGRYGIKFCTSRCAGLYNNRNSKKLKNARRGPAPKTERYKNCLWCGKILKPSARKYCDFNCMSKYRRNEKVKDWIDGKLDISMKDKFPKSIRAHLLETNNYRCSICGWSKRNKFTNTIPLEIDHIDGNAYNNRPDNLRVICPNCHSLTKYYKGANRGNGRRESLKKYYLRNYKKDII